MHSYTKLIRVTEDDLDDLNHVNNVRYVQWIQDAAKAHWNKKTTKNLRNKFYWVVISHFIEYKSSALLNDVIRIKTYVVKSEGFKSTRMVEMYHDKTSKLIVKSETIWCLMDAHSTRPTRIPQEIVDLFN